MSHKFSFHKKEYTLTDEELKKSPYLSLLVNTSLPVDRDEEGRIKLELDVGPAIVDNYFNYLRGNKFSMKEDSYVEFFNFMGHSNEFMYPDRYWRQSLTAETHRRCGNKEGKDDVVLVNQLHIPDLDLKLHGSGIDLYYVGDLALFHAGTISKFGGLTIIYNKKDVDKLKTALGHKSEANIMVLHTSNFYNVVNDIPKDKKPRYRLLKPMLYEDSSVMRAKNPDKIWNDNNITVMFVPAEFNCIEELLYLFPADTDGIVLHKRDSNIIDFKMTNRTYNALYKRKVYLRPDKITPKYIERLCTLSLMGFKIVIPNYTTNVDVDMIHREYTEQGGPKLYEFDQHPSEFLSMQLAWNKVSNRYTVEDYIALLSIGPTRPIVSGYMRPKDKPDDELDYMEIYPLTLFSHEDIFQYQFDKNDLGNRTEEDVLREHELLPKLYRVTRLRLGDEKIEGVTYDERGFGYASLPFIRDYVFHQQTM